MPRQGEPASVSDRGGHSRIRWWRWFAVLWLALGVAGVGLRHWYVVGLAGLFVTGYLAQEVRAVQREEAPGGAPKALLLSVLAAGLGAWSVYLTLRATLGVTMPWWVVLLVFAALLALYAAGPSLGRRARSIHARRGPRFPGSWPP